MPCVCLLIMLLFLQVRQAQMAQYNYILVVGAEEVQNGQVRFSFFRNFVIFVYAAAHGPLL